VIRDQPRPIFGKPKSSAPVIPLMPISPSPGLQTPPQYNPFPPTTPPFAPLDQSPVTMTTFPNVNSLSKIDDFSLRNSSEIDGAIEMEEERTQQSPKIPVSFYLSSSKSQNEPAQNFPMPPQNSLKNDLFLEAAVQYVKAPVSKLEMYSSTLFSKHIFSQLIFYAEILTNYYLNLSKMTTMCL
jgi:hypothetical protein